MNPGGYVLVAADGLDISDSSTQTIDGLYARLEQALETRKMVILTGVTDGEAPVAPGPIILSEGTDLSLTLGSFSATVTFDDEVTPVT